VPVVDADKVKDVLMIKAKGSDQTARKRYIKKMESYYNANLIIEIQLPSHIRLILEYS
jgi:hypothetical protein